MACHPKLVEELFGAVIICNTIIFSSGYSLQAYCVRLFAFIRQPLKKESKSTKNNILFMKNLINPIKFNKNLQLNFSNGELVKQWAETYPQLFDQDDIRLALAQPKYHFAEWLAAIIFFRTIGYHSLIEKYEFGNKHKLKRKVVEKFFSKELLEYLDAKKDRLAQFPDLLVYEPEGSNYFFCETKKLNEKFTTGQPEVFIKIEQITGKKVQVLRFEAIERPMENNLWIGF